MRATSLSTALWIIDAQLKSSHSVSVAVHLTPIWNKSCHMWGKPPVMTVSNTICILHWWVRPHCDHRRSPRGVCEKCVYPVNVWSVCVCVWGASSRQKARGCCLTRICKGRQYGSLTCPAPLSVAHTSPSPPRWLRCSLNTSSRLPQAQGGEADGTQVALTMRILREKRERAKTLMNTFCHLFLSPSLINNTWQERLMQW